jgi:hypothetical protein
MQQQLSLSPSEKAPEQKGKRGLSRVALLIRRPVDISISTGSPSFS